MRVGRGVGVILLNVMRHVQLSLTPIVKNVGNLMLIMGEALFHAALSLVLMLS